MLLKRVITSSRWGRFKAIQGDIMHSGSVYLANMEKYNWMAHSFHTSRHLVEQSTEVTRQLIQNENTVNNKILSTYIPDLSVHFHHNNVVCLCSLLIYLLYPVFYHCIGPHWGK